MVPPIMDEDLQNGDDDVYLGPTATRNYANLTEFGTALVDAAGNIISMSPNTATNAAKSMTPGADKEAQRNAAAAAANVTTSQAPAPAVTASKEPDPGSLYNFNQVLADADKPPVEPEKSFFEHLGFPGSWSGLGEVLGDNVVASMINTPAQVVTGARNVVDGNLWGGIANIGAGLAGAASKSNAAALAAHFVGNALSNVATEYSLQGTRDINLGLSEKDRNSFWGRLNRSFTDVKDQYGLYGTRDIADTSLDTLYGDIEGVPGTSWNSSETSMDTPGGTPDPNSYETTVDSTKDYYSGSGYNDEAPSMFPAPEVETWSPSEGPDHDPGPDQSGFADDPDYWADGGYVNYAHGGMHLSPTDVRIDERLKENYGESASLIQTPNFYRKITPRTRNQSITIPPTSIGNIDVGITLLENDTRRILSAIPAEIMERENLKSQKRVNTKRAELKGIFKITETPDFMAGTLIDPKEVRVSMARTKQEVIDAAGEKIGKKAGQVAAGITLALDPDSLNAIVNADYAKKGPSRNLRGDVRIPLFDDTELNLGAQRNLIEGGPDSTSFNAGLNTVVDDYNVNLGVEKNPDSTSYNAGLNTPVFGGIGNLGFNYRRTPEDSYIGGQVTIPLGGR